jgi:gas vesicle protein
MEGNGGKNIFCFLSGAALGIAAALLLAPDAGGKTREKLAKSAQKSKDVLGGSGRDLFERGRDLYEKGREIAEEAAEMFERGRRLAEKKIDESI